jgi:hypothetical protein
VQSCKRPMRSSMSRVFASRNRGQRQQCAGPVACAPSSRQASKGPPPVSSNDPCKIHTCLHTVVFCATICSHAEQPPWHGKYIVGGLSHFLPHHPQPQPPRTNSRSKSSAADDAVQVPRVTYGMCIRVTFGVARCV